MLRAVEDTLEEIGAGDRPRLLVLNKVDQLDDEQREGLRHRHPDGIQVSALTSEGVADLELAIEQAFARTLQSVELLLPYSEGGRLAELHDVAGDLHREDTAEGVHVVARLPAAVAERYARFSV
jgi:GTP-binding protein HflX